jgi:hypothetical protein
VDEARCASKELPMLSSRRCAARHIRIGRRAPCIIVAVVNVLALHSAPLRAHDPGPVEALPPVVVAAPPDPLLGNAESASAGRINREEIQERPLLRPAEVLEAVPGLIVTQHSGDGKANQYFLRGFNLDHGTDFAMTLLGMPINMPTHAHGQGYSDLQFLIPELVDRVSYRKGPYAADQGDFATAGSADIDYVRTLPGNTVAGTIGDYSFGRLLLAGTEHVQVGHLLYALETGGNQGPWQVSQHHTKWNGLLRYSEGSRDEGWSLTGIAYTAQWTSTDQVARRAIGRGLIAQYGSLDPSDGGDAHRFSLAWESATRDGDRWTRAHAYAISNQLQLWSDFTYCVDSIAVTGNCNRGDQFTQYERRNTAGGDYSRGSELKISSLPVQWRGGLQLRQDWIPSLGLGLTTRRQLTDQISQDRVREGRLGAYGELEVAWTPTFRSILGLRGDIFRFDVASSTASNTGHRSAGIGSPKLALIFGPYDKTEWYANMARGFHSNDARGVTATVNPDPRDPGFGQALSPVPGLVRVTGYELGVRTQPIPGWNASLALWRLDLDSELKYEADTGRTTPFNPSRREGIEWSNRTFPLPHLALEIDLSRSRARYTSYSTDPASPFFSAGPYVAEAVDTTAGVRLQGDDGAWSYGATCRYFGPRALIEDNSVRSASSSEVNVELTRHFERGKLVRLEILNLLDHRVSDIDYYYTSQMRGEPAPVNDLVTHPAEPRGFRVTARVPF